MRIELDPTTYQQARPTCFSLSTSSFHKRALWSRTASVCSAYSDCCPNQAHAGSRGEQHRRIIIVCRFMGIRSKEVRHSAILLSLLSAEKARRRREATTSVSLPMKICIQPRGAYVLSWLTCSARLSALTHLTYREVVIPVPTKLPQGSTAVCSAACFHSSTMVAIIEFL